MYSKRHADGALEALEREVAAVTGSEVSEVVDGPRAARVVFSARMPAELSQELAAAADAEGVNPSAMIRRLVEEALHQRRLARAERVTVDLAELHRMIDRVAKAA